MKQKPINFNLPLNLSQTNMRKKIIFLLLILSATIVVHSQTSSVKGTVRDTSEKKNLSNAVISLLNYSDSVLIKFNRSDKDGNFIISNLTPGKYVLMITYPKFADYADSINLQPGVLNLDVVPLTPKSVLLREVVIRANASIRIKGDTTEFVADSFKVKDGATVEDLLKRLPGLSVNSKGEITAQGKRVDKVLVDGEEFFGDDPTMATQNISARAVDKVQVYDTKSEQQQLTGISSGSEGKTVNIKLKEDSKKGAFGKAYIASNANDLVDAKALYNKFVGKKKLSVYGTKSDISTGSLNWQDQQKLGVENDYEYDEISGYYYSFGSNDEFNDWSLRGLPHAYTAGALFSNKWNSDKNNFNTSYRYNRLATSNEGSTLTQNILANSITYRNKFPVTTGINQQHALNGKYEWKADSLTSFKFSTAGVFKTNDIVSDTYSEFLDQSLQPINKSDQHRDNHTEHTQFDNQLTYRQQFKKPNRLLIGTFRYGIINDDQNGIITTDTRFYQNNVVTSTDIADQQKIFKGHSRTYGAKITFSEPLTKKWTLVTDYGYNKNASESHRNTFNKDNFGKYENLDSLYSNNFDLDVYSHNSSVILKYLDKKFRVAFGTGISSTKLKLFDNDSAKHTTYDFFKVTPQVSVGYTIKPQTNFSFNYRGTTRQPTIEQLQPIRDNADRLNIFIGNPSLKVAFNHSFSGSFYTYKVLTQKGFYGSFNYNIPVNSISFYNTLDITTGKQTYTPVNVNGNRNWSFYSQYYKEGGDKKLSYYIYLNTNGGTNINFINGDKNATKYMNSNLSLTLRYSAVDKMAFDLVPKIGYNTTISSFQKDFNNNYWDYGGRISAMLTLPYKIEISSDCNFDLHQQLSSFGGNPNITTWNLSVSKKIFKNNSGKFFFIANDLLDQNKGFNRTINSNFISEDRYSKISRYFLLKFEWSFNKAPGSSTPAK
ncbi:MAG: TonB-dependent receptor [Bacteroidia bacterium]|nr:TonB-dependent receptor [Bacteroidia bacterium]